MYLIALALFANPLVAFTLPNFETDGISLLKRKLTPDNTCGGSVNGYTCDPTISNGGPCCSGSGYCGKTSAYCNSGCQWTFSNPGCNFTYANTCGGANGYSCNPQSPGGGSCCSTNGYCGSTAAYCLPANCQSAFGSCFGKSRPAYARGANAYEVVGVGTFTTFKNYTFTTNAAIAAGGDLKPSNYTIAAGPGDVYSRSFVPANVAVSGGFLRLTVPGGQSSSPIAGGEIQTVQENILYASVRTYATFSSVPGTCHGNFFYKTDTQESDIEYLTDPNSTSNPGNGLSPLQLTNQAVDGVHNDETHTTVPSPTDATTAVHEYRVDWIKGQTTFYLDGILQANFTTNVPSTPGEWIWNNWSTGNPGWSVGPPKQNNVFLIQNIVMYYNISS